MKIDPATFTMLVQFATLVVIVVGFVATLVTYRESTKVLRRDLDEHRAEDKDDFKEVRTLLKELGTSLSVDALHHAETRAQVKSLEEWRQDSRRRGGHQPPMSS